MLRIGKSPQSIRFWLLTLVASAVLPVTLFAGLVAERLARAEQQAVVGQLRQRTETLAHAVERQLDMSFAVLSALAVSPELQRDDFAELHAYARRVLTHQAVGTTIGLVGRDGRFIFLTRFPFGQELPPVAAGDISESVFATGKPQASDLFLGTVTLDQLVTLDVPVFRNGQVIYDLRIGVRPASLEPVLAEQLLPEYWTSVIVDRKGRYIARSHAPDLVGEQASVQLRTLMAVADNGVFDGHSAVDVPIKGAFQRLPSVGWVVAIGVPQAVLNAPLRRSLALVGLGGAVLLTAGCLGALLLARRVGLQLAETRAAAIAVGEGAAPAVTRTDILELFELRKALGLAHHLLSQRAERLTMALEAARAAAWEYDHETGCLTWSPESASLYGFDAAHPPSSVHHCFDFIFDEDRPNVEAKLQHPGSGDITRAEFRIRHPQAGRRWLLVVGRAIYAEDQSLLKVVGLSIDITERRNAEEATLRAKLDAERANLAKSRFLASASHDLRQPVQSLMLFCSLLCMQLKGREAAKTVDYVEKAALALKSLLDGILDISRLEAGIIQPGLCAVGGGPLLDFLAGEYRVVAAQKGVELRLVRTGVWLRSDPALLERILRNLIDNAIKYTSSGRVLIGCRRQGGSARIEIWDTGIGIPDDQREAVFQEFHQIDNPERDRAKGLGLGLAIVERLARLLNHQLRMRSEVGRGSCFSVTVPLTVPETPAKVAEPVELPRGQLAVIIDDEEDIRTGLRRLLEKWGYEVLAGADHSEVVRPLAGRCPDLVLADYRLRGGLTGADVLRALAEAVGDPGRAVLLTGDTAPQRIADARAGGYEVLHKPVTATALRVLLAEMKEGGR